MNLIDAIAVYLNDVKVGYVANSEKTSCNVSSTASELKNLPNMVYAEYLMNYQWKFHIVRIIW